MPETRFVIDSFGEEKTLVVENKFSFFGQEYMVVKLADNLCFDPLFLRVELDNYGNEMLILPLKDEGSKVRNYYYNSKMNNH